MDKCVFSLISHKPDSILHITVSLFGFCWARQDWEIGVTSQRHQKKMKVFVKTPNGQTHASTTPPTATRKYWNGCDLLPTYNNIL